MYSYIIKFGLAKKELEKDIYPFENKQTIITGMEEVTRFLLQLPEGSELYEVLNIGQVDSKEDLLEEFKKQNKPDGLETGDNQQKEE